MTENNAAQAVQESERNAAVEEYFGHRTWIKPTASNFRLFEAGFDRAYALLSKLRAEGVQAGDTADEARDDIAAGLQDSAYCAGLQRGFMLGDHGDHEGLRKALESRDGYVKTIRDARAALASAPVAHQDAPGLIEKIADSIIDNFRDAGWAMPAIDSARVREAVKTALLSNERQASAPVAGEAVAIPLRPLTEDERAAIEFYTLNPTAAVRDLDKRLSGHAAPKASEAVRNAGIELAAAWVDKRRQDFDNARCYMESETGAWSFGRGDGATAKEEYSAELAVIAEGLRTLKTQADKDGATCSCPTGDGSLRHPCVVHADCAKGAGEAKRIMRFNIHGTLINPHPNGMYVRYEDHCVALAAQKQGDSDA